MVIRLLIDVIPKPLPRARHASRNGYVSSYYTKETKEHFDEYQNAILNALSEQSTYSVDELLKASEKGNTVRIVCCFYMPIPKSLSKKKSEKLECSWHDKKPDLDNLVKMILDRSSGILFQDDNNIAKITATKKYSKFPKIELCVEYEPLL